jgi:hypothetical protein
MRSRAATYAVILVLSGVMSYAATAGAWSGGHAWKPSTGCEVEAEGTLPNKASFEVEAELEHGKLKGKLELKDKHANLSFDSTALSALVVDDAVASIQGSGKVKGSSLRFNATIDARKRTFAIRLSSGYAASGSFGGSHKHGEDDDVEIDGSCPFDGEATVVVDPARAVSATIGRAGGSIAAGNLSLMIPAGALSADTTIRLTPLLDLHDSPLALSVVGGAKLETSTSSHARSPAA